jgi:hypothetical protein
MKKLLFLFFVTATTVATYAQSAKNDHVVLSTTQNKRYLRITERYFTKLKNLPAHPIRRDVPYSIQSKEKTIKDRVYSIVIDSAAQTKYGSITSLTFYVRPSHAYFPLEILTYSYTREKNLGTLVYHTHQHAGSKDVYNTSEREIRERFERLVLLIDQML